MGCRKRRGEKRRDGGRERKGKTRLARHLLGGGGGGRERGAAHVLALYSGYAWWLMIEAGAISNNADLSVMCSFYAIGKAVESDKIISLPSSYFSDALGVRNTVSM